MWDSKRLVVILGGCYNLYMNKANDGTKTAAIFDLDGTLFTGHFWNGIVKYNLEYKARLLPTTTYLATHYSLWIANKLKILSEDAYKTRWGEDLAILLRGFTREEMAQILRWIDINYIARRLR